MPTLADYPIILGPFGSHPAPDGSMIATIIEPLREGPAEI